ncbi:MAG: hypothetical protein M5U28_03830 [Sandaracinaceae bacterium]|nr:hypothetical protein [Sandaracinaceae bacterium]
MASWRGVFINVWNRTATVPTLRRLGALTDSMRAEHPAGFVTIAIIPTHLALTPADARKEAEVVTARAAGCTHALAYVFEGTGVRGGGDPRARHGGDAHPAHAHPLARLRSGRARVRVAAAAPPPPGAPAADPASLGALLLALRVRS